MLYLLKVFRFGGMKTADHSLSSVLKYMYLGFTLFFVKYQVLSGYPEKILLGVFAPVFMCLPVEKLFVVRREKLGPECTHCPLGAGMAAVLWRGSLPIVSTQGADGAEKALGGGGGLF